VYNLIDNAIKYTPENPHILVALVHVNQGIQIIVKDNGIGINVDNQKKIFDKLYRVPTGNVHNVKGFGLGLSYVKAIIDKHQGKIAVQSVPGTGTTIIVTIPTDHETTA
jgi:two-component system phosphate regulon sensor histidine kinase PhoR